jgi:hypothetical protein
MKTRTPVLAKGSDNLTDQPKDKQLAQWFSCGRASYELRIIRRHELVAAMN